MTGIHLLSDEIDGHYECWIGSDNCGQTNQLGAFCVDARQSEADAVAEKDFRE